MLFNYDPFEFLLFRVALMKLACSRLPSVKQKSNYDPNKDTETRVVGWVGGCFRNVATESGLVTTCKLIVLVVLYLI